MFEKNDEAYLKRFNKNWDNKFYGQLYKIMYPDVHTLPDLSFLLTTKDIIKKLKYDDDYDFQDFQYYTWKLDDIKIWESIYVFDEKFVCTWSPRWWKIFQRDNDYTLFFIKDNTYLLGVDWKYYIHPNDLQILWKIEEEWQDYKDICDEKMAIINMLANNENFLSTGWTPELIQKMRKHHENIYSDGQKCNGCGWNRISFYDQESDGYYYICTNCKFCKYHKNIYE